MFRLFHNFYGPENAGSGSAGVAEKADLNKEDVIELLGEDEPKETPLELKPEKKEVPDDEDKVEEEEEEVDELKEIEDELDDEATDDKLELVTLVRRKEILAKYPKLFKDFPSLEFSYYRDRAFTELLPTVEDARIAVEKSKSLDTLNASLLEGDTEKVLALVKNHDINAFHKIVDNYLPNLANVDQTAYHHVLGSVIKNTIVAMVQEARSSDNDALKAAAQVLNQFVFGSSEFKPPTKLARDDDKTEKPDDKIRQRERELTTRQFEGARDTLNEKVDNVLKSTVNQYIDPKNSMTDYVKKNASREALESLEGLINRDTRFKALLDKLWERAFQSNFSQDSTQKIKDAYLSKAKTLLPSVIKKARNEALKGMGKRVIEDEKEEVVEEKEEKPSSGKSRLPSSSGKKAPIPEGMRSIDYLMQD